MSGTPPHRAAAGDLGTAALRVEGRRPTGPAEGVRPPQSPHVCPGQRPAQEASPSWASVWAPDFVSFYTYRLSLNQMSTRTEFETKWQRTESMCEVAPGTAPAASALGLAAAWL